MSNLKYVNQRKNLGRPEAEAERSIKINIHMNQEIPSLQPLEQSNQKSN